jgi:uncharacterized protein YegL
MKTNLVRVVVLLDRSGSMEKLVEATVSGVNEFVKSLKSESGDVNLKVVRFDSIGYETVWDEPLEKVPVMTAEMFVPRGGTPLLDSYGSYHHRAGPRAVQDRRGSASGQSNCHDHDGWARKCQC